MTELVSLVEFILPALAAGAGSVIATRVSVARLQEDVRGLFRRVEALQKEIHQTSIDQEREIGTIKTNLATVAAKVDSLNSPWTRSKADR
jgi:hypothetical protein